MRLRTVVPTLALLAGAVALLAEEAGPPTRGELPRDRALAAAESGAP